MIAELLKIIDDLKSIQSRLVLIIGNSKQGKTLLLNAVSASKGTPVLNVGSKLGNGLRNISIRQRSFEAAAILRELSNSRTPDELLLLDNIEILFDHSLKLDPLDLLKRQAQIRPVVAVWPGELSNGRLTYADMGHPEYQEYGITGIVPFEIQS
jgi:hypothetical protein